MPDTFVEGERPICVARQHIAIFIPYALVCVAALAVGLGVMQVVSATLLLAVAVVGKLFHHWLQYKADPAQPWHLFGRYVAFWAAVGGAGWWMLGILPSPLVMFLVVAVLLGIRLMRWHFQTYTLTNTRVITAYGVINRVEESLGLDKIQHTTLSRDALGRLFGYGHIDIRSAGRGQEVLDHLADAESFHLAMLTAVSGPKAKAGVMERFVAPSYDPGSGYAPPLGYGSSARIPAGGGGDSA
jgi:membrane protein YdbS with pleckstrin-like domain